MDMIEINRISKMLNSTDLEMQELGVKLLEGTNFSFPATAELYLKVHYCKAILATRAYALGRL